MNIYESEKILAEYLLFHYGTADEILPYAKGPREALDFPVRCSEWVLKNKKKPAGRVLDLGCAVGRSSFELTRGFGEVTGIDFSLSFIKAASTLKKEGRLSYSRVDEGILTTELVATLPSGCEASKAHFRQGDACALPSGLGSFDAVLMANLLCRLPDPAACLERSKELVKKGGILVLATPCTWMEEFTPLAKWLGGCPNRESGQQVPTLEGIKRVLEGAFELVETADEPFLIREHARKFQWSVSQISVWKRN